MGWPLPEQGGEGNRMIINIPWMTRKALFAPSYRLGEESNANDGRLTKLQRRVAECRRGLKALGARIADKPDHPSSSMQAMKLNALERLCGQMEEFLRKPKDGDLDDLAPLQDELERGMKALRAELEELGF